MICLVLSSLLYQFIPLVVPNKDEPLVVSTEAAGYVSKGSWNLKAVNLSYVCRSLPVMLKMKQTSSAM